MAAVTKQDYYDFAGIDLDIELKKSNFDNPSKAVEIFLRRIEDWMRSHVEMNFFYETWDDDAFKLAVLHQIDYVRMNGELYIDAANTHRILSPMAFETLHRYGMANITPNAEA